MGFIVKEYDICDCDIKSTVLITKRQKDILSSLDEMLNLAEIYPWEQIFEDDSFYIEYFDGTHYEVSSKYSI